MEQKTPSYRSTLIHSVMTFLGQSLMQMVDLLFVRDLGPAASATVGTATSIFAWFLIIGLGVISSLEFLIPNALGAQDRNRAGEYFSAGVAVVFGVSMISFFGIVGIAWLAPLYGMNPEIVGPVQEFCEILAWSYFPTFFIPLFRIELQSHGLPHASTIGNIIGNILNVIFNWAWVLGHLGFEAMGTRGSALANLYSRIGIFLFLFGLLWYVRNRQKIPFAPITKKLLPRVKEILRMGVPTSFHMLFEIGAFILVSTLASRLDAASNAAHTIAISIASFAFMIPMGMSSAAALTMGRALGEEKPIEATKLGDRTLYIGALYSGFTCVVFLVARVWLVGMYTNDSRVVEIGSSLILVAGIFQLGDAIQVILAGAIRGFGETMIQAKMNAIGHWLIGIPMGIVLAFLFNLGVFGLWIGLCAGLFAVAGLLWIYYRKTTLPYRV